MPYYIGMAIRNGFYWGRIFFRHFFGPLAQSGKYSFDTFLTSGSVDICRYMTKMLFLTNFLVANLEWPSRPYCHDDGSPAYFGNFNFWVLLSLQCQNMLKMLFSLIFVLCQH